MLKVRYLDIAKILNDRIQSGHWKDKFPGVAVLSKELEVNPRTISRALKILSEQGKITIRGTRGTFITQGNPSRPRYTTLGVIGMVFQQRQLEEMGYIHEVAQTRQYHVMAIDHSQPELFQKEGFLSSMPVDGFIFTNSLLTPEIVLLLRQAGIPFVSLNRIDEVRGVDWVDYDNEQGRRNTLEYLLSLGHRRIACISFKEHMAEYAERMETVYRQILHEANCYDPCLYIHDSDMRAYYRRCGEEYQTIYGMEKAASLMNMVSPPTAVVLANIQMAYGFIRQARQMGYEVPKHVSVVAQSQSRSQIRQEKFLTLLTSSSVRLAMRGTQILLDRIQDPSRPVTQELVPTELVRQQSVAAVQ